jgi:hypothetical protein
MPRPIAPKRWTSLVAASAAAGLSLPAQAAPDLPIAFAPPAWITPASGEAGEGGESGAIEGISTEAAYLTRLALVEGHLIAAALMHARGYPDEAAGLAGHPEAEMMDEVRATLTDRGAADFTRELEAVGAVIADGASPDEVRASLLALQTAIDAAGAADGIPVRARLDAMLALTRAAAHEYETAIAGGPANEIFAYHESLGFLIAADRMAQTLAASPGTDVAAAAQGIRTALAAAIAEYGDLGAHELPPGDPSVLHGAAARVEIAALRID